MDVASSLPKLSELGTDLSRVGRLRTLWSVVLPVGLVATYFVVAHLGFWWLASASAAGYIFFSYTSTSHDLVHRALGLPPRWNRLLLTGIELLGLRSGTAYRLAHLNHHRRFPYVDDVEAYSASRSIFGAIWAGVAMQPKLWCWAYRRHPSHRRALLLELGLGLTIVLLAALAAPWTVAPLAYLGTVIVASWVLPFATVYLPHRAGHAEPLRQTRWFTGAVLRVLFLQHLYHLEHHLYSSVPHQNWPKLAARVAPHLRDAGVQPIALSWGSSGLPDPNKALPRKERVAGFWFVYWVVFFALLPIIILRQILWMGGNALAAFATYNRTVSLMDGGLEVIFVNRLRSLLITIVFGERFQVLRYGDKLIDPGPPFAAQALRKRLRELRGRISAVLVTHAHEEHFSNAGLVAEALGARIYGSKESLEAIRQPAKISAIRALMIGQPRAHEGASIAGDEALAGDPALVAVPSSGHCEGHVSFYDPVAKVLLVGDSFMHEVFTSPNVEVDSDTWIDTLRRYAKLDVRVMVGSHGHVTTLDPTITGAFVVERQDPNELIRRKLEFTEWARAVVRLGEDRGLPYSVIEASLFPWSRTWSWKNFVVDEGARLLSGGEFSRTHFVCSLARDPSRVPARFWGKRPRGRSRSEKDADKNLK